MGGFGPSIPMDEETPLVGSTRNQDQVEVENGNEAEIGKRNQLEDSVWYFKVLAFICSCLISSGSHFAAQMLSSLKSTLLEELDITNAQYGILQSTVSLVNTITPFFGGLFIDKLGTGPGSLIFSSLILVGDVIVASSTHISSFPMMVVGRMIYGIGSGGIVTVQEAILAHWFKGSALAFTVGFQISISRLSSLLATGTVPLIAERTGFYGNAFWASAAICLFSWLSNILYLFVLRKSGNEKRKELERLEERMKKKNAFSFGAFFSFSHLFWLIILLSFAFGLCWAPYLTISPDLIKERFNRGDEEAAWESTYGLVIPVVLSPFLGFLIDRWGRRALLAFISGGLLVISFGLLGFTMVSPIVGLLLFSLSYTFGPVAMISSIPLLLEISSVGTALGLYKCASNIGSGLVDPVIGVVQDLYQSYHEVMIMLCSFAGFTTLAGLLLFLMNHFKFQNFLDLSRKAREELFKGMKIDEIAPKAKRIPTLFYLIISGSLLVSCWAVYFSLVIMVYVREDEDGGK